MLSAVGPAESSLPHVNGDLLTFHAEANELLQF
jgi:hypothetical protein